MRKTILLFLVLLYNVSMVASPALRIKILVSQPDGTKVTLVKGGDEHISYYITSDNYVVIKNASGAYCYVWQNTGSGFTAGKFLAHDVNDRSRDERVWLERNGVRAAEMTVEAKRLRGRQGVSSRSLGRDQFGSPVIPVILVQYSDIKFTVDNVTATYQDYFNAENFTGNGGCGSVRDYFVSQSMGKYTPTFDIVGVITLSNNRSYYGQNDGFYNDVHLDEMVSEAVEKAESSGVDFSKYSNGDGRIPVVSIVYAGVGEQSSDEENAVWAKFSSRTIITKGGTISSYLVTNELFYNSSESVYELDGIGVFCHEFSHFLGLPDFYNTNESTDIFGLSFWSIMDYGQYWANGKIPVGYTAYEREFMGWLSIDTLETKKQLCHVNALGSESQNAYYILNDNDDTRSEYYILENRQPSTWFPKTLGSGLLIMHVDYSYGAWADNEVNNDAAHQRMTIIPADGKLVKENQAMPSDYQGDLFPGITENTSMSDYTTPAFAPYRGGSLGKYITSISESNGVVSFCYMADGVLEKPENLSIQNKDGSRVLMWNPVEEAETYCVEVYDGETLVKTQDVSYNFMDLTIVGSVKHPTFKVIAKAARYVDSPAAEISFENPLSVGNITGGNGGEEYDVYTIEGVLLCKDKAWDELEDLPNDKIYILRSKKSNTVKKIVNGQYE